MTSSFAQTQNTGNLKKFIQEIPSRGVPDKVTQQYLESIGFKSRNDRTITTVLKSLGILDSSGAPTVNYSKLRNKATASSELAILIKKAYSSVFGTFPDAQMKDAETLRTWFASHTTVGEASVKNMEQTFTSLCSIADFNGLQAETEDSIEDSENDRNTGQRADRTGRQSKRRLDAQVAFNIQIQIPGDQPPEVYESIFKNLGKYVLGIVDEE